jgi:hypothetical protein
VSNTVTDEDLINALMNSHPESKILGNSSSDEEFAREKKFLGLKHFRSLSKAGHVTRHKK